MMTVKEVSKLTGVSVRTLQYYDSIGLLPPSKYTEAGYRLYDESALEKLSEIMLFRELEFPLADIKKILESPDYDKNRALAQQIELLELKKEHIENLITLARKIKLFGGKNMDFSAFDRTKLDEYAKQAKETWGKTESYKEFEEKSNGRSLETEDAIAHGLINIFGEFGKIKDLVPESDEAQALVKKLKAYITENYYNCTDQILAGLGHMYCAGGEFTENIDKFGGEGTADFASKAIEVYCKNKPSTISTQIRFMGDSNFL